MSLSRREFVRMASSAGVLGLLDAAGSGWQAAAEKPAKALRVAGKKSGVLAGCAVNVTMLRTQPDYAELVAAQAGILVAENAMKFAPLRPSATEFNFIDADFVMEFAKKHKQKVRGHNFVWHQNLPRWFDDYATAENAKALMVEHIETVGKRYAGRIHSWDVVNEAILPKDGLPNGLRDSPWLKLIGPEYIDVAFHTARRADPKAMLVYNEYSMESDAEKRELVFKLLRGMKQRGVPLDGLGIQAHLGAEQHVEDGLRAVLAGARELGLKVLITELDVNDRKLPAEEAARDAGVAAMYESFLTTALADTEVCAVLTWGITDRTSWLNADKFAREDRLPQRCLPFDAELKPTPAFFAEIKALQQAPRRA